MKTIAEIAALCGLTRFGVIERIRVLGLKPHETVGRTRRYTEAQAAKIAAYSVKPGRPKFKGKRK